MNGKYPSLANCSCIKPFCHLGITWKKSLGSIQNRAAIKVNQKNSEGAYFGAKID